MNYSNGDNSCCPESSVGRVRNNDWLLSIPQSGKMTWACPCQTVLKTSNSAYVNMRIIESITTTYVVLVWILLFKSYFLKNFQVLIVRLCEYSTVPLRQATRDSYQINIFCLADCETHVLFSPFGFRCNRRLSLLSFQIMKFKTNAVQLLRFILHCICVFTAAIPAELRWLSNAVVALFLLLTYRNWRTIEPCLSKQVEQSDQSELEIGHPKEFSIWHTALQTWRLNIHARKMMFRIWGNPIPPSSKQIVELQQIEKHWNETRGLYFSLQKNG